VLLISFFVLSTLSFLSSSSGSWDFTAAVQAAKASDVAIVCIGGSAKGSFNGITHYDTTEKEGMDRKTITMPGLQLDLVKALATQTTTPIVVVLINGGPLAIEWLVANPRVEAIVEAWYPGVDGGTAIMDVLFGNYAPAGKLPITFYHANYTDMIEESSMDMRSFPGRTHSFVQVPVLFPFGYGLSYTSWSYSKNILWNDQTFTASLTVTNTGEVTSDHSILLFTRYSVPRSQAFEFQNEFGVCPKQELVDFKRIHALKPGESVDVSFLLDRSVFKLVDLSGEKRSVKGEWELFVRKEGEEHSMVTVSVN